MPSILHEWENFARTIEPAAITVTNEGLRNHASVMLKSIAENLGRSQSRGQEIAKSHGRELKTGQTTSGEEQGRARLQSEFTIEQLVSAYRALRSSVLGLWNEANSSTSSTDIGDIIRFDEAVDQLLASSVFASASAAREASDTERAQLRTIVDTIPAGLIMLNQAGAIVLENSEWKRTWAIADQEDSVVDRESYKLFRPDTGERISADEWPCVISLKQGMLTHEVVLDIERFNGTRGTIVVSSAPIRDDSGHVVGAVAANMDVTELRAVQAKLVEADRRKDEFLAMLSHELRNPLAPIRNSLYILDRVDPLGQQALNARQVIARQVTHLSNLVGDLLDVTRIVRGKIELQRATLNISELVKLTAEDYRAAIQARGVQLFISISDDAWAVDGDETRLSQVFGNLLTNAAKFTPSGGAITLSVDANDEHVFIKVLDNGIGIESDLLPTIFDPFMQANQNIARTDGGLGLGLALVKGVVELHGGKVFVSSTFGEGTAFTVELPLAQTPNSSSKELRPTSSDSASSRRVLVIDDNADCAESLAELVRIFGHTVEVAYDGQSAVMLAEANPYDLILCDIELPDMNGHEVARRLHGKLPATTMLVAISSYAQPEDIHRSLEAGFNAHFAKPLDADSVADLFG